jgi:DNA-binding CsgD family transcriptional regulator
MDGQRSGRATVAAAVTDAMPPDHGRDAGVVTLAHDFLLAELRRGRSPKEIAAATRRSERSVYDYLAFHGYALTPEPGREPRAERAVKARSADGPADALRRSAPVVPPQASARQDGRRASGRLAVDVQDLARRYQRGDTLEEIAREVGVSAKTVHRRLVEASVALRPAGPRPGRGASSPRC